MLRNIIRTRLQSLFQQRPPGSNGPWRKRALILTGVLLVFFILGHLGIRFVLWPQLEKSKPALERLVSARLGANITMDDVQVSWTGIRPSFEIWGLRINTPDKSPPPLFIEKINGQLSWISFYHLAPYFHEITFNNVQMYAGRDAKGIISIAGIPIQSKSDDYSSGNWLLDQNDIQINSAQIFWDDHQSKHLKTAIEIQDLHFENGVRHHYGTLRAFTPWSKDLVQINADFIHRLSGQAGNWRDWVGNISWDFSKLNLTQLAKDFTLPLNTLEGNVSSKGKINLNSGKADGGQLYLGADQLIFQLNKNEDPIEFGRLETNLVQEIDGGLFSVSTQTLAWRNIGSPSTAPLEKLNPMTFRWKQPESGGEIKEFGFSSPKILIEDISVFALNLPLPKKVRHWIKSSQADGELLNLEINWAESKSALATLPIPGKWFDPNRLDFSVSATLNDVSFLGINKSIPTVSHLSGNLSSNQKQGSFTLKSSDLEIEMADFLSDPQIKLDKANGNLSWVKQQGGWLINAKKMALSNPEITAELNLIYFLAGPKQADLMTLDMAFSKAKLVSAHRYLPVGMSTESRQYLTKAFESGVIENGTLHIKGDPNEAPYPKGQIGELSLHLPITGATFKPAPLLPLSQGVWPALNNVSGSIDMEQSNLQVSINRAVYKKTTLANVRAEISNVSAKLLTLLIHGEVDGPAPEILDYLFSSPVGKKQPSLEKNLSVFGPVSLNIGLKIPLSSNNDVSVDAKLILLGNKAQWGDVPPLENLRGKIRITETNPEFENITANFLGGSLEISSASTTPNNSSFNISGDITANFIKNYFAKHIQSELSPLLNSMSGSAKYDGTINFNKAGSQTNLQFDLLNWTCAAPKPANKLAGVPMLGQITLRTYNARQSNGVRADWNGKFSDQYFVVGSVDMENKFRHALGVGANTVLPQEGFAINYVGNELDLDTWQDFAGSEKSHSKSIEMKSSSASEDIILVTAQIKKTILFDRAWNDLNLSGKNKNDIWQLRLNSPQIAGQIQWRPASVSSPSGLLSGRLARLKIPEEISDLTSQVADSALKGQKIVQKRTPEKKLVSPNSIPSLELTIDDFSWSKAQLGLVKMKSLTSQDLFTIESLQISNPQGNSTITGQWQGKTANTKELSAIDIDMEIKDAGAMIARWTDPKSVEGGQGKLLAKLNWLGPIFAPSYETLAGTVNIDLTKGRLLEVNTSGAKLLDVLSLQSLFRFATFDLQGSLGNLATKGTPFNSISSNFEIAQGIAQTQQFNMVLDQARVAMIGQINIPQETQDLRITIFPTIDATAGSLAAFAINPIVGLGALLGQYLITNHINRTMQTDYLVQGSWTNPEVVPLDQKGQPLDGKTLETIRSKGLLKEQSKPSTPNNPGIQPIVTPS